MEKQTNSGINDGVLGYEGDDFLFGTEESDKGGDLAGVELDTDTTTASPPTSRQDGTGSPHKGGEEEGEGSKSGDKDGEGGENTSPPASPTSPPTSPHKGGEEEGAEGEMDYVAFLGELHKRGIISDPTAVGLVDEDDNPIEVNADNLLDVISELSAAKAENEYSGLSEFTRTLIDVEKKGGNVTDLLYYYNNVQVPAKETDISTEEGQIKLLKHFYTVQKRDKEEMLTLIEGYQSRGILKEMAEKAKDAFEADEAKKIEAARTEQERRIAEQKEFITNYKAGLKESLKKFQLNEATTKRLIESAVSQDKEGIYALSKAFREAWSDPEKAADLVYFLTDKEGYLRQVSAGKVNDNTKQIMRKILITRKDRSTGHETNKKVSGGDFEVEAPEGN